MSGPDDERRAQDPTTGDGLEPVDAGAVEAVTEEADAEATVEMMHLLHEGVPLALIADLATPGGPDSPEILAEEGLPDVDWLGDVDRGPAEDAEDAEDAQVVPDEDLRPAE